MKIVENENFLRFESKKDFWVAIILWISILLNFFVLGLLFVDNQSVTFTVIMSLIILGSNYLIISIYFFTYYILTDTQLIARSGPVKYKINLDEIKSIQKTTDILSSVALSIHRIKITYRKSFVGIQISPPDRDMFIAEINKRIEKLKSTPVQ